MEVANFSRTPGLNKQLKQLFTLYFHNSMFPVSRSCDQGAGTETKPASLSPGYRDHPVQVILQGHHSE